MYCAADLANSNCFSLVLLVQEKYRKDQEKLDEEWKKAQQDLVKEGPKDYEEVCYLCHVIGQHFILWMPRQ